MASVFAYFLLIKKYIRLTFIRGGLFSGGLCGRRFFSNCLLGRNLFGRWFCSSFLGDFNTGELDALLLGGSGELAFFTSDFILVEQTLFASLV